MKSRSLRMRLLAGAVVAIFVALAAAWFAMTLIFERHIERRVKAELTSIASQVVADLAIGANGQLLVEPSPAEARFQELASGLYWQVTGGGTTLRSRSLWDTSLPVPAHAGSRDWQMRVAKGPYEPQLILLERLVQLERGPSGLLVQVGYNMADLLGARAEFGRELALFLALLWVILSAAAWLQVELGLRPLKHVRQQVETLQSHPQQRLTAEHASEIEPLAQAINELADARERDLAWARRRAADLAHGLKTPLAALAAQSRRAREAGATQAADGLDGAIAAATTAVETELARSRAAATRRAPQGTETPPLPLVESVVGVVERTEFGGRLVFQVDIPGELRIPMLAPDLTELLGALIENAARYAHRRVRIAGISSPVPALVVEDDGPGIGDERTGEALIRGSRIDEAAGGHGLGLSIAHDLVEATEGELALLRSELGGLKVVISWPIPRTGEA